MNKYAVGETLYVIRSGMKDLINRQVIVLGDGRKESEVFAECVGDWTFPHGEKRANVAIAYLSPTKKVS